MRAMLALLVLAFPAAADEAGPCPPAPDISAEAAPLFAQLASAPDAQTARGLMDGLWHLWTTAPDARAQALLDEGMDRREAFDFEAAEAALGALIAYCPAYPEGYNQRAFVRFLRADYGMALDDLEKVLDLSPQHVGALSGAALTLMQLGRIEAGQAMLRAAVRLDPWLPERSLLLPRPGQSL
jgi:tetratricopeptide (TPR) repeat protein